MKRLQIASGIATRCNQYMTETIIGLVFIIDESRRSVIVPAMIQVIGLTSPTMRTPSQASEANQIDNR